MSISTASPRSVDCDLQRHAAQNTLFCAQPARADLLELSLPTQDAQPLTINVWRNHNFETLSQLIEPYSLFGRWHAHWNLSAYDDTLLFEGWQPAAAELIWLDAERAGDSAWLAHRVAALRALTRAPILLASWLPAADALQEIADVYVLDLRELCRTFDVPLLNERTAALAGTPISKQAQPLIARELGCRALPALLFPPIKGIALDLDDTLHAGVLAEDGAHGVQLTDAHRTLQLQLKALRERGVYLCLVSRNEPRDVAQLYEARADYPLRPADFSVIEVSWNDKPAALQRCTEHLRIAPDALLFVDDNAGELAASSAALPSLHTLHAQPDAALTLRALDHYPGLWRFRTGAADAVRIADLQANTERTALAARALDPDAYFRSLQVQLSFRYNAPSELERAAELSAKTNQFNLALKRWNVASLREYLSLPDASIVSVQLQDRLSDSGVIAVLCAHRQGPTLRVEELCISCRALGRRLEHSIVMLALRALPGLRGCTDVEFAVAEGARNQPALRWLEDILQRSPTLPAARVHSFAAPSGITATFTGAA
jgi:FkbH-like protein